MYHNIIVAYDSLKYKIEWVQTKHIKFTHLGKHWPLSTTCTISKFRSHYSDQIKPISIAEITKHKVDDDQLDYALRVSLKVALSKVCVMKVVRKEIWREVNAYLKTKQDD